MTFHCTFCDYNAKSISGYIIHLHRHRNSPNVRFLCPYPWCMRTFHSLSGLKSHVYRNHQQLQNSFYQAHDIREGQVELKCRDPLCQKQLGNYRDLMKHLKMHLSQHEPVICPFWNCKKQYSNFGSLSSHTSRYHSFTCSDTELTLLGNRNQPVTEATNSSDEFAHESNAFLL